MDWNSYLRSEGGAIAYPDGNIPEDAYTRNPPSIPPNVIQPALGKYIGFMAVIYFIGAHLILTSASILKTIPPLGYVATLNFTSFR